MEPSKHRELGNDTLGWMPLALCMADLRYVGACLSKPFPPIFFFPQVSTPRGDFPRRCPFSLLSLLLALEARAKTRS